MGREISGQMLALQGGCTPSLVETTLFPRHEKLPESDTDVTDRAIS